MQKRSPSPPRNSRSIAGVPKVGEKNRNASLASIQVEVSPPPGFFGFL